LNDNVSDVVYVHGLWLTGAESVFLRRRLEREHGLRLHAFRYPTVRASMRDITERLHRFVQDLQPRHPHFIGHSLGGLVIYRYLERFPPEHLSEPWRGRVVFLGTPSVTSRAAVSAARTAWIARLVGKCVAEELLVQRERRWTFPTDLGVIAGTRRMGLGQFFAGFDEDCDGTIAVSETRMPGAADHVSLPVSHLGLLVDDGVAQAAAAFLKQGKFTTPSGE
jgi:pimeloyl-ACP methyl ester carboxylesterase